MNEKQEVANTHKSRSRMNEAQQKEFNGLVLPLMKFLGDNFHPHMKVIVELDRAELVEGVCSVNRTY